MPNMKLFPSLSPLSTLPKSGGRPRNGQLEVSTSSQEAPRNQEPGYHSRPLHLPRSKSQITELILFRFDLIKCDGHKHGVSEFQQQVEVLGICFNKINPWSLDQLTRNNGPMVIG
ncbi:hypothetical protein YC2023_055093 [Brassica napus]|uniref:(rape) hypothetical protein n=1 Tax=Brassica napus TaxID=3708 RepID=A0A816JVF1_BRANA|nr:unnamed protein product [Brassica napus]